MIFSHFGKALNEFIWCKWFCVFSNFLSLSPDLKTSHNGNFRFFSFLAMTPTLWFSGSQFLYRNWRQGVGSSFVNPMYFLSEEGCDLNTNFDSRTYFIQNLESTNILHSVKCFSQKLCLINMFPFIHRM